MKRPGVFVFILVVVAIGVGIYIGQGPEEESPRDSTATSSAPSGTDLAILSATVQRVADPDTCGGHRLCLVVTVANWGPVDVTGMTDGCGSPSFGDLEPWANFVLDGVIPADTTMTLRSGFPGLERHLPATFTLFCEIDAANRFNEPNETNNIYTTEVTL